ncbi:MAG: CHAT domain-containing protein [Cyanobacteria bacterium]|nr:CHAT domain-containing protein [Cyanobacteria bacterium GSL.Bin21]
MALLLTSCFLWVSGGSSLLPSGRIQQESWAQTAQSQPTGPQELLREGMNHYQAQRWDLAIQAWQKALSRYQQLDDANGQGLTLGRLGLAYEGMGNYPEAVNSFEQSLTFLQDSGNRTAEASVLGNLGNNYLRLGNYPQALDAYNRSLAIWEDLDNAVGRELVLRGLGNLYLELGEFEQALALHEQALQLTRTRNDPEGIAQSLNSIAAVYMNQGKFPDAIAQYQLSLTTAKKIEDETLSQKLQAQILSNLGYVKQAQKNHDAALAHYQQSLDLAQAIQHPRLEGIATKGIGTVYMDLENIPKAMPHLKKSLSLARQLSDPRLEASSLHVLGSAYWIAGDLVQAEKHYKGAIKLLDDLRDGLGDLTQVSMFDTQIHSYALLRRILVEQNKYEEALEIAEHAKARAFVELLAKRVSPVAPNSPQFEQQIAPPDIQKIREIAQEQNATLVEYAYIADEEFVARGKIYGQYIKLHIWVVQPTGEVSFQSVDLSAQDSQLILKAGEWANDWLELLQTAQSTAQYERLRSTELEPAFDKIHRSLYSVLIEPIADLLPSDPNAAVIFIPRRELFQISFPALQDANGTYLIEKHTILTAPAIQVLDFTAQRRNPNQNKRALVVGNPEMPKTFIGPNQTIPLSLGSLPGAEEEAQEIAQLLGTKAIIGKEATEAAISEQMGAAQLIHLATHGLIQDFSGSGVPGAIALASSGEQDGILTSDEILKLDLQAELVVLSACDTGRGHLTGDGVIGLSRSILAAGASSLVVPLWAVNDEASANLMVEFYRQQRQSKAQALRQAMLSTMEQYPHPIEWGAFTMIGQAN